MVDLPPFDTAAMDGWAVCGAGPWTTVGEARAGDAPASLGRLLSDGEALRISTGAVAPPGTAVLRSERGNEVEGVVHADPAFPEPQSGGDIRVRGEEIRAGELILSRGQLLTPPAIGLAAAAGHDDVAAVPRPRVAVIVLGAELVRTGVPEDGRLRDALSPQLPGWIEAMGGEHVSVDHVTDSLVPTSRALHDAVADVVITTGGTARGPADHMQAALAGLGGHWLVDGVAVRPGHPMKLGRLADGRGLVALPGNPLAAVSGLVTLAWPLLDTMAGRPAHHRVTRPLADRADASPSAHRLVPGQMDDGVVHLTTRRGPAMLSGMATADVLAVIPPGPPADVGTSVEVLPLPWGSGLLV